MPNKKSATWNGKPILDAAHADELEQAAATYEFGDKLSRKLAEERAYHNYRRSHHLAAAAHHLRGMKSAQGSGDRNEGRKHSAMYEMHMSKLGLEPWAEAPPDIKAHIDAEDKKPVHKFRAHHGDALILNDIQGAQAEDAKKSEQPLGQRLHRIWEKATEVLRRAEVSPKTEVLAKGDIGPGGRKPLRDTVKAWKGAIRAGIHGGAHWTCEHSHPDFESAEHCADKEQLRRRADGTEGEADLIDAVPHHGGDAKVLSIKKGEAAKPTVAPPPLARPAPALHSTVEGFMGGLKALPKVGPERGKYITAHMGHAPFISTLQQHPQGKQVHAMLNQHLNSARNAGIVAGKTVAVAKSEEDNTTLGRARREIADCVQTGKHLKEAYQGTNICTNCNWSGRIRAAIPGGGETTEPKTGHLKIVKREP